MKTQSMIERERLAGIRERVGAAREVGQVSARRLAALLPEYFSSAWQVLRLAKLRVIPCAVLPRGGVRRSTYLFRPYDVVAAMEKRYRWDLE